MAEAWASWFMSMKLVLISCGVLSLAMVVKFSVPLIIEFAINEIPVFWSAALSLLKPPYLYVVVNCIILTIAASSLFHNKPVDETQSETLIISAEPLLSSEIILSSDFDVVTAQPELTVLEHLFPVVYELKEDVPKVEGEPKSSESTVNVVEDSFVIPKLTFNMPERTVSPDHYQSEFLLPSTEKPLVSARFVHRKPFKASPSEGGRALKVAKPRRHETLESTWKMITEGRHVPLSRHLKKSDRLDSNGGSGREMDVVSPELRHDETKSEVAAGNCNNRSTVGLSLVSHSSSKWKVRKDPSMSHDELNRRVEAFIKKVNEEMRKQRQESLNQYKGMINNGTG